MMDMIPAFTAGYSTIVLTRPVFFVENFLQFLWKRTKKKTKAKPNHQLVVIWALLQLYVQDKR